MEFYLGRNDVAQNFERRREFFSYFQNRDAGIVARRFNGKDYHISLQLSYFKIELKGNTGPHRLAWSRTGDFHSSNTSSNLVGAAMHPKYQEVIKLRKKGKSYREIAKIANISKNLVSKWCKNLKLSVSAQKILEKKSNYPKELFAKYNRLKSAKAQIEHQKIKKEAASQIRPLSRYELILVGSALYWGEGYKKENPRASRINFANSDPAMVKLFLDFIRKNFRVPENKFKVSIRIYPNINKEEAVDFWSKITKIPKERFGVTEQISRASRGKRPKNSLPYGTLSLTINDYRKFFQIKGWIDGLIRQT